MKHKYTHTHKIVNEISKTKVLMLMKNVKRIKYIIKSSLLLFINDIYHNIRFIIDIMKGFNKIKLYCMIYFPIKNYKT